MCDLMQNKILIQILIQSIALFQQGFCSASMQWHPVNSLCILNYIPIVIILLSYNVQYKNLMLMCLYERFLLLPSKVLSQRQNQGPEMTQQNILSIILSLTFQVFWGLFTWINILRLGGNHDFISFIALNTWTSLLKNNKWSTILHICSLCWGHL